jgi:hypothetical protein
MAEEPQCRTSAWYHLEVIGGKPIPGRKINWLRPVNRERWWWWLLFGAKQVS